MSYPVPIALAALVTLAACAGVDTPTRSNIDPVSLASAPPGAAPGTCWDKTVAPAVVETQSRRVELQPAQISSDGRVQS
ncbi:MAG: peptidoglycan-binding protein, partial [Pseudomonadota bacterium]